MELRAGVAADFLALGYVSHCSKAPSNRGVLIRIKARRLQQKEMKLDCSRI